MIVILMLLRNNFKETRQEGGDSRDLFWLLCTCIWTDRVRKLFIPSLILDEFSRGKLQIPCFCKQQTNIKVFYVTRRSFLTTSSKDFQSLLEVVWKNTARMEIPLR